MTTRDVFLEGMSRSATTVSIVTTDGPAGRSGATVSAMSSVSADSDRPSLLVCVNKNTKTADVIRTNGRFCVNVLRDSQAWISDAFAGRTPIEDKFAAGTWLETGLGSWSLENALVTFDCELKSEILYGSHYVFIGEVEDAAVAESGPALVYSNRSYGSSVPLGATTASRREIADDHNIITVAIGCYSSLAPFLIPRIISDYRAIDPNVDIKVYEGNQDNLIHHLGVREADFLITYQSEIPDWWTKSTQIASLAPYVLLPALHPLADQDSVSLEQLKDEPMVLLDSSPLPSYVMSLFVDAGLSPNIAYRSPSYEMVRSMVGNGLGYTILGTNPASPITLDGRLTVSRAISDTCEPSSIVLVTDTSRDISDEARAVHAYIAEQLSNAL
ncbi:MAG: flavin reductase [Actinomycetes bacterium]